jgi:NTE family protein
MKKLILCLGSGGIRGFTHIGVLKAIEDSGLLATAYFGTSVGSLISVLAASGKSAHEIEKIALSIGIFDLLDLTFPKNGFIKGFKLKKLVEKHVTFKNIEDLPRPVFIMATNGRTGEGVLFTEGLISERVQASCAIPNIFRPVKIDQIDYLDGDLKSPVPMKRAREKYADDVIVGVNIIARIDQAPRNDRCWAKWVTKDIYRRSIVELEKQSADLYLDIDIGYKGSLFGSWPQQQIEIGYQQMLENIPKLRQLLASV